MQSAISDKEKTAFQEIARKLESEETKKGEALTAKEIWKIKLDVCGAFGLTRVPKNSEVLFFLSSERRITFEARLRRKSIRTRSGIAVVTVITKPFECPHGTCTFCPGGVRFGTPQSYTKNSPAAAFGIVRDYDAKRQAIDMLHFLNENGHDTSKVELILLGGTILAMPDDYQSDFVKQTYEALNGKTASSLEEAIEQNEIAAHRCVGLTIETKPDWCKHVHIDKLLSYGGTRVEIGVQSLRNEVLSCVNRGHTVEDTVRAFQVSRDSAFKIVAHMMPGLPLSDLDKDLQDLNELVADEKFRPDMLKIYPTLVVEGTALYKQYKMGKYTPYSIEQLTQLLSKFKQQVPPWIRIMRIQREIPKEEISSGAKAGNLRQLVLDYMASRGEKCKCIRCREVGHRSLYPERKVEQEEMNPLLKRVDYDASRGHEVFLSYEDRDSLTLYGFIRLRIPSGNEHRPEIRNQNASLVRELHVYGSVVPVGQKVENFDRMQHQHRGLGTKLLEESERISSEEFRRMKQIVISAVGTREYYRKRGYKDDGAYVSKLL